MMYNEITEHEGSGQMRTQKVITAGNSLAVSVKGDKTIELKKGDLVEVIYQKNRIIIKKKVAK